MCAGGCHNPQLELAICSSENNIATDTKENKILLLKGCMEEMNMKIA